MGIHTDRQQQLLLLFLSFGFCCVIHKNAPFYSTSGRKETGKRRSRKHTTQPRKKLHNGHHQTRQTFVGREGGVKRRVPAQSTFSSLIFILSFFKNKYELNIFWTSMFASSFSNFPSTKRKVYRWGFRLGEELGTTLSATKSTTRRS
jgi:hypothetical protein